MRTFLVVDDEPDIRDIVIMACEMLTPCQVSVASSGNEAINILKEKTDFSAIFCDYRMSNGNGGEVFKFMVQNKLNIPYVMVSSELPSAHPEIDTKILAGYVEKPKIIEGVQSFIKTLEAQSKHSSNETPTYLPVRIRSLLGQAPLKANLFVKLSETKFVKLYKAGDMFGLEDAERMKARKISNLYIQNGEVNTFLNSVNDSFVSISSAKDLPPATALKITESTNAVIQNCFVQFGWSPELDSLAKKNLDLCQRVVNSEKAISDLFKKLSADPGNYFASRTTLMSFFTLATASAMGWSSEVNQYKLTLASQLHDIGLDQSQIDQYQSLMRTLHFDSPESRQFKAHPEKAAELIRKSKNMPPDLDKLVSTHHERPDGSGFPAGLGHNDLDQLSALFIICGNLVDFIIEHDRKPDYSEFFEMNADLYLKGSFREVFQVMSQNLKK